MENPVPIEAQEIDVPFLLALLKTRFFQLQADVTMDNG